MCHRVTVAISCDISCDIAIASLISCLMQQQLSVHCVTCVMQHATCNSNMSQQHATCNMSQQHVTATCHSNNSNMQHATCVTCVTCVMQQQHATAISCVMQQSFAHVACNKKCHKHSACPTAVCDERPKSYLENIVTPAPLHSCFARC